jgi:predicted Zn-dependent protease
MKQVPWLPVLLLTIPFGVLAWLTFLPAPAASGPNPEELAAVAREEARAREALHAGRVEEARAAFEELSRKAPDRPTAWLELGHLAMRESQPARAAECYERAGRFDPYGYGHLYGLSRAYRMLGRVADADRAEAQYRARLADLPPGTGMGADLPTTPKGSP